MVKYAMDNDRTPQALRIEFLGNSEAFLACNERIARAATVDRPVLLVGERGTGKELAAARLHYLSMRWQNAFIPLNCAAMAPALLESELFGHETGAFTGAVQRRIGRFEAADGGTLFLDELAAMPLRAQEKVLRVVEYGEFERLGGMRALAVDVRLVAATNADLPALCDKGRFKRDLLDRLCFEVVTLPPLRERENDVLLLAERFAASMALELGLDEPPAFSPTARTQLFSHDWPGNVRELRNTVQRAVFHSQGSRVEELQLDPFDSPWRPVSRPAAGCAKPKAAEMEQSFPSLPLDLTARVRELEVASLRQALEHGRHNQREAAQLLGLSYHQFRGLYRKYKEYLNDTPTEHMPEAEAPQGS